MGTQNKIKDNPWKEKTKSLRAEIRRLKQKLKRQTERGDKWRMKFYNLKSSTQLKKVKRHKYPLELIWISVLMNISFNISLRGVSQTLPKVGELFGLQLKKISPTTIRNWSLKFGLHCLSRPLEKGKYVIISDESVEINKEHLLLLLLVRIEKYSMVSPLRMSDVRVLDLGVKNAWKGDEISAMIEKRIAEKGIELAYGLSDKDSTLRKAYRNLGIPWIGDCTHEMANQAAKLFKKDEMLNEFIKKMNLLRAKWILSKYNRYIPPGLRSKSRFHQIFILHKWGRKILDDWDNVPKEAKVELMFLKRSESLISVLENMYYLVASFSEIFKSKGIQASSMKDWQELIEKLENCKNTKWTEKERLFSRQMTEYLDRQKEKIKQADQILCCSDVIESSFGKYKNKGGAKIITEDVLKIAAYPNDKTIDEVKQAMEQVKIKDILDWKIKNTTVSKLALIKNKKKKTAA